MPQISKRLRISFSLTYLKNPMDRHISVLMNKRIATMRIKKNYKNNESGSTKSIKYG